MTIAEQVARYRAEHGDADTAELLERAYPPARRLRDEQARRSTHDNEGDAR